MTSQEAQIQALIIQAKAVEVEVIAMQTHAQSAVANGTGSYSEEAFLACSRQLGTIAHEIQLIAREGFL